MTQDAGRETRPFSTKEGVYKGGGLKFVCKHPELRFSKEIVVRDIREDEHAIRWSQGNFILGTSNRSLPLRVEVGDFRLSVTTTVVKNQHGLKVECLIEGTIPKDVGESFTVKPIVKPVPKKKTKRR